ncbi:copper chaperone PCu(A)C [Gracilimonas tropica]|uniref:copper chaperone PCu(A)C n=1 Tax=Gracilimonas tropica TaxID=454600 RepID=UPI000380BD74|nr:copper chaperone PCu(A)C [Gracilimonas tropica]
MNIKPSLFLLVILGMLIFSTCTDKDQASVQENEFIERVRPVEQSGTSAAYFLYENELMNPDTLLSITSNVSDLVQVHETYKTDDGMMGMRERKTVVVEAGEVVTFEQGGLHVMLINVEKSLAEGDSVQLEMVWARAGKVQKKLPVQP